jgi:hypothetical protein
MASPKAVALSLALFVASTLHAVASYKLEHSHRRVFRLIGHGLMAQGAFAHFHGYALNMQLENALNGRPRRSRAYRRTND